MIDQYIEFVEPSSVLLAQWEKIPVDALVHSRDTVRLTPITGAIQTTHNFRVNHHYVLENPYTVDFVNATLTISVKILGAFDPAGDIHMQVYEPVPSWAETMELKINDTRAEYLQDPGWITHHKIIRYGTRQWLDSYGGNTLGYYKTRPENSLSTDCKLTNNGVAAQGDHLSYPLGTYQTELLPLRRNVLLATYTGMTDDSTWDVVATAANESSAIYINRRRFAKLGYDDWDTKCRRAIQYSHCPLTVDSEQSPHATTTTAADGTGEIDLVYPLWFLFETVKAMKNGPVNLTTIGLVTHLRSGAAALTHWLLTTARAYSIESMTLDLPLFVFNPNGQSVLNAKIDQPALIPYTMYKYFTVNKTTATTVEHYFHSLASLQSVTVYQKTEEDISATCYTNYATSIKGFVKKYVSMNLAPLDQGDDESTFNEPVNAAAGKLRTSKPWRDFLYCMPNPQDARVGCVPTWESFTIDELHGCICTDLGRNFKSLNGGWYTLDSTVQTLYQKLVFSHATAKVLHVIIECDALAVISNNGLALLINSA